MTFVSPQSGSRLASPCPFHMASACSDPSSRCSRWVPPLSPYPSVPHVLHIPPLTLTPYRASCSSPRICSTSHETTGLVGTHQPPASRVPATIPMPSCPRGRQSRPPAGPADPSPSAGIKGGAQLSPVCCGVSRGAPSAASPRQGPILFSMGHRCVPGCEGLWLCRGGVRPLRRAQGGWGRG